MKLEVCDDFLPREIFDALDYNIASSDSFPWYFSSSDYSVGQYQFIHNVYNVRQGGVISDYFSLFHPILEKLKIRKLDRIKINFNPRTFFHKRGPWHIDNNPHDPYQHTKTAILYLNTNNGWTEFKKHGRVKSKLNRIALFDSPIVHRKVFCTDKAKRVIVNFNYDV